MNSLAYSNSFDRRKRLFMIRTSDLIRLVRITICVWVVGVTLFAIELSTGEAQTTARTGEDRPVAVTRDTNAETQELRIGIIGLDTSHAPAFTRLLNSPDPVPELAGCKVVAAYPHGSPDIESSTSRIPTYTQELSDMGIEIVESIDELIEQVDCVLLETNDGRPHLEQVVPVLKAGKPVFVDKPVAGSLVDAYAIFLLAESLEGRLFSSSSLRFSSGVQAIRNGAIGDVIGCDAYSPCSLESTHPDLFWYGIHGVELLFTAMGPGCETVTRVATDETDLVIGNWGNGRIGTFRGIRNGRNGYGGTAFGSDGIQTLGSYEGYQPLVVEIVAFFHGGDVPIDPDETLDLYAFMEAADESKRRGGESVSIDEVKELAKREAEMKVKEILSR